MTKQQRLVLLVAILASFVALLDASVVNVALPAITTELGGGLVTQQWVIDAYLITLGSLMLIAGSLSDLFGRLKLLSIGIIGFALTSILCAIAPTDTFLIVSRALQGIAGAILVPSSLALIISNFQGSAQGKAIGLWSAWISAAYIIGPLLGGALVDIGSWRYIFAINIVPVAITLWFISRIKKEKPAGKNVKVDVLGAIFGAIGLGGIVFGLIEHVRLGWHDPLVYIPFITGILAMILFVWQEKRVPQPMLPLDLFKIRNFWVGNIVTVVVYGALALGAFLVTVFTQQIGGFTATQAGLALMPVTILIAFLSTKFGALSGKYGPRLFMTIGPIIVGLGFLLMLNVDESVNYWQDMFAGVLLFGTGMGITVAPLTSGILSSIDPKHAGVGSAVNNAIARIAGLISIAFLGIIVGSTLDLDGFHRGALVTAILLFAGGIISYIGIRNPKVETS